MVQHHDLLDGDGRMTLITFTDGKPVMRDGKVGTGETCCCAKGCDCCEDDYFYESGLSDDFMYVWTRYLYRIQPDFQLVRKDDAPSRDCLESLFVYISSIDAFDTELCNSRYRIRVYVPDCQNNTLTDITLDYEEPGLAANGYERLDFWEWGYPEKRDSFACSFSDFALRDWPPEPQCNPLP